MEDLIKRILSINEQVEAIRAEKETIDKRKAATDADLNDCYHVMEYVSLNGPQMSKLSKKMRAILQERRELKESAAMIESVLSRLGGHGVTDTISKSTARQAQYLRESNASYKRLFGEVSL